VQIPGLLLLYVGPDQILPVTSVLASIAGIVMIFWNKILGIFRRIFGSKSAGASATPDAAADNSQTKP